ncbi:hypothetical protein H2248_008108 [Termitomyces sp. 'cryptogamus']|nr:hypothetical protein H2248_008108 [Termitomyces sp. 'cryptogamus']
MVFLSHLDLIMSALVLAMTNWLLLGSQSGEFEMSGVVSGKWLGLWVVPNNRHQKDVAFLFLHLVNEFGGLPLRMSTDCSSKTTQVFGLANALKETFHPELSTEELPTYQFL